MVAAIGDFGTFKGFYAINARIGPNINAPNFYADGTQIYMQGVPVTINSNGVLTSMNNAFAGDAFYGISISTNVGVSAVKIRPGSLVITDTVSGGTKAQLSGTNGSNAFLYLANASAQESFQINASSSGQYPTIRVFDGVTLRSGRGGGFSGIFDQQVTTPAGTRTFRFIAGLLLDGV